MRVGRHVTDPLTPEQRSRLMSHVKGRDTTPEMVLRRLLHRLGYRFRLHRRDLPGSPDIVLPRYRTAVFVHGCFWHRHPGCAKATTPKANVDYWLPKFAENIERDARKERELAAAGWRVLIVWQCELATGRVDELVDRLLRTLPRKPSDVPSLATAEIGDATSPRKTQIPVDHHQ